MPTRRPQGEGALYYSESHERWEGTVTLPDGRRKTITSSKNGTKQTKYQEAKKKLEELKKQVEAGGDAAKGDQTLQKYMQEEWIPAYQLEVRDSTYEKRRPFLEEIIREFGGYKLKDLRPDAIQKWVTRIAKRLAPSTIKMSYGLFKRILADAVELGYLVASPCRGIKRPTIEEEEMNILGAGQRKTILSHLSETGHRYESLFVIALTTAMRIGEIRALQWSDIHFDRREIAVRDNLVYIARAGYQEHKPKTRAGVRDIPLTDLAIKKLHAHRAAQKEQYFSAGQPWSEEVLVWQGTVIGKPFTDNTVRRDLNKALSECGLPIIRIHDLRHTAITWMIVCRMHLKTVQKIAGHAKIEQTLKYMHALPETIQEDMLLFNAAVG